MVEASIVLPATLSSVERARGFVRDLVRGVPFSEEDLFHLELAVTEICVNIARYGYAGGPGEMALRVWEDRGSVFVEFVDQGIPFDPRTPSPPTLEALLSGGRKGGLGIYLARRLTDSFDYRRDAGRNVVTISKKVSTRPGLRREP
jgi:anti-sigma regulatory factor (Ser/Thr protein kinase)